MNNWFEELSAMRKEWVEITHKNNFDEGIRHSTVEKYPDPVHFVYELLQNAEDQGATEARFELSSHRLIFYHNGNPFTRVDVENITGIGNSDKTQEANKIGRFGIGFKSVFAITERPEVYTILDGKPFAFAIEELVTPIYISEKREQSNHFNTQFVFPFIKDQENTLYSKIKERLVTLGAETMLFLRNLRSIEWRAETEEGTYLCNVQGSRYELFGESSQNGQLQESNAVYLMFTRKVSLSDSDRELDVRIAFKLDETGKIVAIPNQKLAVYFPTEQETGLNFRIHGPFLLTDNRANIKNDNEDNKKLIHECAILLGESIKQIKEMGLLTIDFLAMLPIRKEHVAELFQVLYDHVVHTLKRYPLLPTLSGTFANATQVKLARSNDLRELVSNYQLSELYDESLPIYWLPSEITVDRMPDLYHFLDRDLEVEVIDPAFFVRILGASFVEKQTDEWLEKLYVFLSKQPALDKDVKEKPVLRLEDGRHVSPIKRRTYLEKNDSPNAYLLRQGDSEFPLVKKSLLTDDVVYNFLKRIGLSEPDIVDEVLRFILPSYTADKIELDDEVRNRQDLNSIQNALQHKAHRRYQELINTLKETPFLRASNAKTSELAWKSPRKVHYRTHGLAIWLERNEQAWFINESLSESLTDLNIPTRLRPIATAAGITGYVSIKDEHGDHQRGLHGFDPNARLYGLQHALEHITFEKAKMLWNILLEYRHLIKGVVETSTLQTYANATKVEKFSPIGELCSRLAWLPDQNGDFYIPEELFLSELSEGFENDSDEARELSIKLGMRKAEELQLADKLGIPHDLITLIQHNPEAIRAWYREQERNKVLLPSSVANDVARRIEKATQAAYDAPTKMYKEASVYRRISAGSSEVRAYLRIHNTNADGQLICQLCNHVMPFTLPDGEAYFEAYQYIDILEKEYEANHLALCPNCAAEFEHACRTDDSNKAELILNVDVTGDEIQFFVPLDMPVHRQLRFTQRHLIDLQAATRQWLESEPEYIK